MKQYQIKDEVFKYAFEILVGKESDVLKYLNKHFKDASTETIKFKSDGKFFVIEKDGVDYCFIWIPQTPKTYYQYAVLQHELLHCLFYGLKIIRRINPSNDDAEECYAYLHEWITRTTMKRIYGKKLILENNEF